MPRNQMTKNEKASETDKTSVALYQEKQIIVSAIVNKKISNNKTCKTNH